MLYGDYAQDSPPRAIIDDVVRRRLDVAVVWGPLAGYFARRGGTPLHIQAVSPLIDGPLLPMVFDISMGVRKEDRALRRELDAVLTQQAGPIQALLREYGIPTLSDSAGP
jgi:mxaJ protein